MILIVLLSIIGLILIVLLVVWLKSPGKLAPLKDAQGNLIENSIAEKVWIEVNGIKQGMFIRSENPKNPVLLYLHADVAIYSVF
ncbi:MAG: hypothetical protein LBC02_05785 [Planctomycetaceae bacterium]|nr:hypothetical protein [Planctomycetaceae bacterium]